MGDVFSKTRAAIATRTIDNELNKAKLKDKQVLKLLLLGTGDSGKSTIVKQMKRLYGSGITKPELKQSCKVIHENIIYSIRIILGERDNYNIKLADEELSNIFSIEYLAKSTNITAEVALNLSLLWNDEGFQQLWENRAEMSAYDNLSYYLENIERIGVGTDRYEPTVNDYLNVKVRTIGVSSEYFRLFNCRFELVDVGGQRGEREKWIHYFANVLTVLFVTAISEFDQNLFEDKGTNREVESLQVLSDVINKEEFTNVGFVLFLNKLDLFEKKVCDKEYRNDEKGYNTTYEGQEPSQTEDETEKKKAIEDCLEHTRSKYIDVIEVRAGDGLVKSHFSTALNSQIIEQVFKDSRNTILNKKLAEGGFPMLI